MSFNLKSINDAPVLHIRSFPSRVLHASVVYMWVQGDVQSHHTVCSHFVDGSSRLYFTSGLRREDIARYDVCVHFVYLLACAYFFYLPV